MFTPMNGRIYLFQQFSRKIKSTMNYYAVARGRRPGVYRTWDECKPQVDKYPGALYKKFPSLSEANRFIEEGQNSSGRKPQYGQHERNTSKSYSRAPVTNSYRSASREDFEYGPDGRVQIYTDGACLSNGYGNAKAGIGIYFYDDCPLNVSEPVCGRATNNNAEIQAVTRAAEIAFANGLRKVRINTDSEFLINCINKWMPVWKKRNWKTARGLPVINKVELQEMEEALSRIDVVFNHVRGHMGIYGNEMADRLARSGAEEYNDLYQ